MPIRGRDKVPALSGVLSIRTRYDTRSVGSAIIFSYGNSLAMPAQRKP